MNSFQNSITKLVREIIEAAHGTPIGVPAVRVEASREGEELNLEAVCPEDMDTDALCTELNKLAGDKPVQFEEREGTITLTVGDSLATLIVLDRIHNAIRHKYDAKTTDETDAASASARDEAAIEATERDLASRRINRSEPDSALGR